MPAIRTDDLTRRFGAIAAVDGLDLEVISGIMVDIAGVETISTADRIVGEVPFYLKTWLAWMLVAA